MNEKNEILSNKPLKEATSGCTDTTCCPPKNPFMRSTPKVGRNDPCPCGSGKKYKQCCGKLT